MTTIRDFVHLLFRPIKKFILSGPPFFYGWFAFVRDEYLPSDLAEKLRLGGIFEVIAWYWYVVAGVLIWGLFTTWEAAKTTSALGEKDSPIKAKAKTGGQALAVGRDLIGNVYYDNQIREPKRVEANFRLEPMRRISDSLIGVRVFNNENADFTHKVAELLGFAPVSPKASLSNLVDMLPREQRLLKWHEKEDIIEPSGHGLIEILSVDWDGIHFHSKNGSFILKHTVDESTWKIGLEIRGKLGEDSIIPMRCCVTFMVGKNMLKNNRIWWAVGLPSLEENDCQWAKSISAEEYLELLEKQKQKKKAR